MWISTIVVALYSVQNSKRYYTGSGFLIAPDPCNGIWNRVPYVSPEHIHKRNSFLVVRTPQKKWNLIPPWKIFPD